MVKICCIGGPTKAVTALKVPSIELAGVDIFVPRINAWNSNQLPIYEAGLDDIVEQCREKNIFSSTDVKKRVSEVDIVFVSVNTPIKTRGIGASKAADLTYWESVCYVLRSPLFLSKQVRLVKKIDPQQKGNQQLFQIVSYP